MSLLVIHPSKSSHRSSPKLVGVFVGFWLPYPLPRYSPDLLGALEVRLIWRYLTPLLPRRLVLWYVRQCYGQDAKNHIYQEHGL